MSVLAIDPGTEHSAWVVLDDDGLPIEHARMANVDLLGLLRRGWPGDAVVIERLEGYGMAYVKDETWETAFWAGRFMEAASPLPVHWLKRTAVKLHLLGNRRGKDSDVLAALVERFGPKGTRAAPGPLYGVAGDIWAAVAVGVTWLDQQEREG